MSFNLGKRHSSSTSSAWKVPSQLVSESSFVLNFLFKSTGSELSLNSDRFKICSFELLYGQRLILMRLSIQYTSRNSLSRSGIKDMMLGMSHTVDYEAMVPSGCRGDSESIEKEEDESMHDVFF